MRRGENATRLSNASDTQHAQDKISGMEISSCLPGGASIVATSGTRKVRFRREPAVRRVFIDRVGKFAGQPREQLFGQAG